MTRKYSDEEMLDELRRVAGGAVTMSRPHFQASRPRISAPAIMARFGSWRAALEAAGLRSPTIKGGQQRPCDVCGTPYRFDGGRNARKTCSRECSSRLMSGQRSKGDEASLSAARGRAAAVVPPGPCMRCGAPEGKRAHDRHHKDRNPYNNARSNIERLCRACHVAEHKAVGDGWSTPKSQPTSESQ